MPTSDSFQKERRPETRATSHAMHRVTDTLPSRPLHGSPEHSESPDKASARPAVAPTVRAFEGLAIREGAKGSDSRRPGALSFLIKDIESAADALRALENQAIERHRPATYTSVAAPTPRELSSLQKAINRLTGEVRQSRKEIGKYTRNVEELEEQIRQFETELQKLSRPHVPEVTVQPSPAVDEAALRGRRIELQNDVKHCKGKIDEIVLRHQQALADAEIRADFLASPPGSIDYDVVLKWLDKGANPAEVGRRPSMSEQQVEHRIKEFFGVLQTSAGGSGGASSTGDGAKGKLDHLLAAFRDEESAVLHDIVKKSAAHSIGAKCAPNPVIVTAMAANMSTVRHVMGSLLLTSKPQKGDAVFRSMLLDSQNKRVFDDAVEDKAEEFRALLKPPSESPDDLLELLGRDDHCVCLPAGIAVNGSGRCCRRSGNLGTGLRRNDVGRIRRDSDVQRVGGRVFVPGGDK